jgi:hypothetical protein
MNTRSAAPAAWKGPDVDYERAGLHRFTPSELAEIDRALRHALAAGDLDVPQITAATFPLEELGVYLRGLPERLRRGPGFVMLRGLPLRKYSLDDLARIYVGLGSYIGAPINQSHAGDLLGHVIDVHDVEPKSRAYRKAGAQSMHTDSSDVVGLMCVREAVSGGSSRIASALAVHDDIAARRPDLADALRRGFFFGRAEQDALYATTPTSRARVPVFTEAAGETSCYFIGSYARNAEARGHPLQALEVEAIKEVERVAGSPEFFLDMQFTEGDIQFLNNRIVLHGRTDYEDATDLEQRRYLMRLWLQMPSWPALPEAQVFHKAADHALWAANRRPRMDLPSQHFAELRRKAAAPI